MPLRGLAITSRRLLSTLALSTAVASVTALTGPSASAAVQTAAARDLVPASGVLFGASAGSTRGSTHMESFEQLERWAGRKFDLHRNYESWTENPVDRMTRADLAAGRIPMLSVMPRRGSHLVPWTRIASGAEDAVIAKQADAFKALGSKVWLSFNHEPEDEPASMGTPADFVRAWRHYVSVFRARGVTNVSFMWIMMASSFDSSGRGRGPAYYPGDDVVDWIGIDGYNWYKCTGAKWRSFGEVFADFRTWAAARGKPIAIAEYGTIEDPAVPGRKGQWYGEALRTLKGWPQVKAVSYWNTDNRCNWLVQTSPSSLAGFKAMANDPYSRPSTGSGVALPVLGAATVTGVTATGATVTGAVTPGAAPARYLVEYGVTAGYGSATSAVTVPAGSAAVPFRVALTGLQPGTTYHYQVVAENAGGVRTSSDATFRTPTAPVAATWFASKQTRDSAEVHGGANPKGSPARFWFEYGPTAAYGTSTAKVSIGSGTRVVSVEQTLRGLRAGTTYHYRLVVETAGGTARGEDRTVRTR